MVYQGSGGPPPSTVKSSGGPRPGNKPFGFHFYEVLPSGKRKKVGRFRVDVGEKNVPFLFLDEALPETGSAPSVRVHEFKFNGTYGNIIICNSHRNEGCLMDKALEREHTCFPSCKQPCERIGTIDTVKGGWKWVATGIKMKPFTYTKGPLAGQTLDYQRCVLLVPDKQYAHFMAFRETYASLGGLRGKIFNVTREDNQRSSKIGTIWLPAGELTDEQMMEKFEGSAALYGLPVEDFIRPYQYEHVLKELTTEEMNNAAKWVAAENNVNLAGGTPQVVATAAATTSDDDDGDETEIPF